VRCTRSESEIIEWLDFVARLNGSKSFFFFNFVLIIVIFFRELIIGIMKFPNKLIMVSKNK